MDAKDVLKNFIDSCSNRADCLQSNLSSNCCMEWFGRTFRGQKKIERYYRYEIWPQYEHNFVTATTCDPIETKPAHLQTKQEPMENVYASACSKSSTAMKHVYETPPQAIGHTTQPPPLTRGNRFGRLSYDDEDSNVPALESETNGNDVDALPLSSPVPAVGSSLCVAESSTATSTAIKTRKRILITDDVHKSPTKRSKSSPPSDIKKLEYFDKPSESELDLASTSTSTSVKSTGSCEQSSTNKLFTELRYLEAIGSIRTIRRSKHPGINRVPNAPHTTANDIAESVTPFISPESQNGWDRKTKLKISYRIDMSTQEIQYALIIYEPLTMVTRRNLMEEFQQAADEEANRTKSAEKLLQRPKSASKSRTTHLKSDKLLSLRRLRF